MSFASPYRQNLASDQGWRPPTTMVDVLFLILAFFITIAAFREDERLIDVNLPGTETTRGGAATQVIITVTADNTIHIAERAYSVEELRATLSQLAEQFPNETVLIRADRDARTGTTVRVLDTAYAAGLKNVSVATTKLESEL